MQFQIQKRGQRHADVHTEFEQVGDDKIVGTSSWLNADGRRQERFQVITLRDGNIADMQGFTSRRQARRFASA